MDKSKQDETYLAGTKFDEIYALYLFDRELRNLFIRYILEIENNVKSVLAHVFSDKYGHDNYLRIANFDTSVRPGDKKQMRRRLEKSPILLQIFSVRYQDSSLRIIQ